MRTSSGRSSTCDQSDTANRVIIASRAALPDTTKLELAAKALVDPLTALRRADRAVRVDDEHERRLGRDRANPHRSILACQPVEGAAVAALLRRLASTLLPVTVLEQALVQLAGRVARQLRVEVDRARALDVRRWPRQNAISSCSSSRSRRRRMSTGCTTAFTSSPKSSSGTPNTATSIHLRVRDQHVLGLLRIDVHAAGDDHEVPCGRSGRRSLRRRRSRRRPACDQPCGWRDCAVLSGSL